MKKPTVTVGRIVHVYEHALPPGGQPETHGTGPFAAIVTNVSPATKDEPETVDAVIFSRGYGPGYEWAHIPYLAAPAPAGERMPDPARYWTWPPQA